MSDTRVEIETQPAPVAPPPVAASAEDAAAAPETAPTPARALRRAAPVMPAFGLPHVASAEIRAELRRREARAEKLLAERAALIEEMERIEATLEALRED